VRLGIIGGTGALELFDVERSTAITTPFGAPSERPRQLRVDGGPVWFLGRHGNPHRIPPHKVNYRANVHALKALGADAVLAINAVGGVSPALSAGDLVVPDQLIDYTWGRAHTFSDGGSAPLKHIDFTRPFDGPLRELVLRVAGRAGIDVADGGCIAVTQGPRLETAAEVRLLDAAGCDLVGMTTMPEAALAREAGLDYASLCVVANPAAGLDDAPITEADIASVLERAMERVRAFLEHLLDAALEAG
jgi:5'-methylthioinosine phosphorylase